MCSVVLGYVGVVLGYVSVVLGYEQCYVRLCAVLC